MRGEVIDVPQLENCQNCTPCMRMKLMEIGFLEGQEIEVTEKMKGLFVVDMISHNGHILPDHIQFSQFSGYACFQVRTAAGAIPHHRDFYNPCNEPNFAAQSPQQRFLERAAFQ